MPPSSSEKRIYVSKEVDLRTQIDPIDLENI